MLAFLDLPWLRWTYIFLLRGKKHRAARQKKKCEEQDGLELAIVVPHSATNSVVITGRTLQFFF
jgi:hypothetical protein